MAFPGHGDGPRNLFRIDAVALAGTDTMMIGMEKTELLGILRRHSWVAPLGSNVRNDSNSAYK